MTNAMPALLALLLVFSLPAMAVSAASPSATEPAVDERYEAATVQSVEPTDVEETTNRLELTGDIRNETVEYGPDLGTVLAVSDDDLRSDYHRYALLDDGFDDASNAERDEMVNRTIDNVLDRTEELEQRERDATRAHAEGEISDNELLQSLIRNYNEANTLDESIDETISRSDDTVAYSISSESLGVLDGAQERLQTQQGTVRTLAQSSEQGAGVGTVDGQTIAIETSNDGYRLQTMVDDTYVVETTRFDNRDLDGFDEFDDQGEAFDRFEEVYPWAMDDGTISFNNRNEDPANLYRGEISHSQGILTAFIDGNSGDVYHEVQEMNVDSLPVSDPSTETDNGLELVHNETPASGPVEITVNDTESGEPAESATISVDGTEVGETNDEGTIWLLTPNEEYDIEAEANGETVELTIP